MWRLLEHVAALERRMSALYAGFAEWFRHAPPVAAFWRDMAGEEELHALIITAAREVFPASAPPPGGDWLVKLDQLNVLVATAEAKAASGLSLDDAFSLAEQLEASELNALTEFILRQAGTGFSRLGPLVDHAGVDRHRDKVIEARRRFCPGPPSF